jgi:16S rRNA (uracil1498-N3)-methyltransferase
MRTFRSYLDPQFKIQPVAGELVKIDGDEAHHLLRVLRISKGDVVVLFDGEGRTWQCTFLSGKGDTVELDVLSMNTRARIYPQIFLAQCLAKTKAMELLMRHATELGIAGVIPLQSAHTEVQLEGERAFKRLDRLRAIAVEACKQSGNVFIPQVFPIQWIKDWFKGLGSPEPSTLRLSASLQSNAKPLLTLLETLESAPRSITWLVGPEGDLSTEEYAQALHCGFIPVSLASQVLRVETAALYALAATDAYFQAKPLIV